MTTDAEIQSALPALGSGRVAVITGGGQRHRPCRRQAAGGHGHENRARRPRRARGSTRRSATSPRSPRGGEDDVLASPATSRSPTTSTGWPKRPIDEFGEVSLLMNNAGVGNNPGKPWENRDGWKALIDVNFWGAVHGVEAFAPRMLAAGKPGLIVNTGSKQGITTPPGNLAYNVSKAALKTFTEGLAHELRNTPGSPRSRAHLLIPGFTYTGLTEGADRKARRRLDRRAGDRLHARQPGARRFLHPVPRQRERRGDWTRGAWPGRSATSSRTARLCRAGTRTTRTLSRRSWKG